MVVLSPTHRFDLPGVREAVRLALFLVEALTITLLFHHVRRSEAAERQARNQMRDEISRIFQPFVRGASDLPGPRHEPAP